MSDSSRLLIHVLIYSFAGILKAENGKRLLINDPDALTDMLTRLENTVQQLKLENQNQDTTIKNQGATIQMLSNENQQHTAEIQSLKAIMNQRGTGTTYVRWARKNCPYNNTELVYSGYIGGGHYKNPGSSAEPVCLAPDPDFGDKSFYMDRARMYGAEFENNFFHRSGNAQDLPCAVCRVKQATSVIMIPGKNTCYPGWSMEYHGYLASNWYVHAAAGSFVCIDIAPEFLRGGGGQDYGKLFYSVIAKCGSLQCPPYRNNNPLTCVVCSK